MNKNNDINKYTLKIKKFLDNHAKKYRMLKKYKNSDIINLFENTFSDSIKLNNNLSIIKQTKIKKLHDISENSLLYIILSDHYDFKSEYDFFLWLRQNYSKIDLADKKYSEYHNILFNPCRDRIELHKMMYESIFVSLDVVNHSETEDLDYIIYSNDNTEVHIYNPNSNNGIKPDIDIIMIIINFYRLLTKKNIFVKLVVFYGNQKKILPNSKVICSDNVNSGSTIKGEIIQIWRKEEFYKVLIHELVHYFGIDFYIMDDIYKKIQRCCKPVIKINGIDRINESYTEILAIIIHSTLYSIMNNKDIDEILNYELLFSYLQVSKILSLFGCNSYNDTTSLEITQTTSAFSYYIAKCIFFEKLEEMLIFWKDNGFKILNNSEEKYLEFYKKIIKSENLDGDKINFFINLLKDHEKCFVTTTMRMSMSQI